MRELVKDFVRLAAGVLPIAEPIYEFGAFQVPGQEGFADLRPIFPGKTYFGCDMRLGPGVDLILDLHTIGLSSGTAGTVLIFDTLEHVEFCHRALEEVDRILKPGGLLLISSVMDYPIHGSPYDFWRFTPEGFKSILAPFPVTLVDYAGRPEQPHAVVGMARKGQLPEETLATFKLLVDGWRERWSGPDVDIINGTLRMPAEAPLLEEESRQAEPPKAVPLQLEPLQAEPVQAERTQAAAEPAQPVVVESAPSLAPEPFGAPRTLRGWLKFCTPPIILTAYRRLKYGRWLVAT